MPWISRVSWTVCCPAESTSLSSVFLVNASLCSFVSHSHRRCVFKVWACGAAMSCCWLTYTTDTSCCCLTLLFQSLVLYFTKRCHGFEDQTSLNDIFMMCYYLFGKMIITMWAVLKTLMNWSPIQVCKSINADVCYFRCIRVYASTVQKGIDISSGLRGALVSAHQSGKNHKALNNYNCHILRRVK